MATGNAGAFPSCTSRHRRPGADSSNITAFLNGNFTTRRRVPVRPGTLLFILNGQTHERHLLLKHK
ncbi:MAG: hypothetical protein AVDCRST_MAG56-7714 [uncultured Cytophagales bacterium]|uniref:Uncharacterized protein n=1 Tax=uncultured Cytophagales bacterium TaxID=158755 RepID=A0A6J4LMY9_9SPHI|nr:MAG: hypothetical protein AVDCRST_MAG56-7714 [uncultured Cytophagales bacterium]